MADANNAYESKYMSWLTEKAPPERLSELYATYKNIEDECKKARVIKSSLFECLNIVSIHKIKVTVEGSRLYRFFHRKESGKTAEAIRYMLQYVQEEEAASRRELDSAAAAMSETPGSETPYASGQDQTPAPSSDFEESKDDIAADARDTSDDNEHPPVTAEPSPEERVKDALREESSNNLYGATPYYLAKSAGLGVAEVRKMLTAAPWAKKLYGNYIFCEPETETVSDVPVVHPGQVEATPNAEQQIRPAAPGLPDGTLSVNYLSVEGLAFTKPFMMSYFDDRFSVRSWKDALVLACRLLIDDYPDAFAKLREQGALPGAHSVWIVKESSAGKLRAPKEIIPDYYIETNRSAKEIVKIIRTLLDICRVDCDNMVIYYRRLAESPTGTSAETTADEPLEDAQPQPATRELTPELAQLLAGDDFEPLRKKLGEEGVLTIEQFRSVQPWAFMNEHRLYRLPQRQEIYSEIKKRLQQTQSQDNKDRADPPVIPAPRPAEDEAAFCPRAEELVLHADLDGMTAEALSAALDISVAKARRIAARCEHIVEFSDKLVHEEAFVDWEEAADKLEEIIEKLLIRNNGYVSAAQLFEYVRVEMRLFLNDNDIGDARTVYEIAEHLFDKVGYHGKKYAFQSKNHISRKEAAVSSVLDVARNFGREQGGVFVEDDLVEYMQKVGLKTGNLRLLLQIYDKPIFLFYDVHTYMTAESMGIDEAWLQEVSRVLTALFTEEGDHIVLRQIPALWLSQLPALPQNRPWTPLLVQSVLLHYSRKLNGAHTIASVSGQAGDTLQAMLVSGDSGIQTFADAVAVKLADEGKLKLQLTTNELRHMLVQWELIGPFELTNTLPKALANDLRFAWSADEQNVIVKVG